STPSGDQASWCSWWWCHSNCVPTGIGKVATIAAWATCPFADTSWQATGFRKQPGGNSVVEVNENHAILCAGPEWAEHLESQVLAPLAAAVDSGDRDAGARAGAA